MQEYYFSINFIDIQIIDDKLPSIVAYEIDHIPLSTAYNRRSGKKTKHSTITIHNSNNPSSTAKNERDWLVNEANHDLDSFHIYIDEYGAIEAIPLDEVAAHLFNDNKQLQAASEHSIAIVICESGRYETALSHASQLVAELLFDRNWEVDRLRRHFDWTGKNCPRKMNVDGVWSGWYEFVKEVNNKLEMLKLQLLTKNQYTDSYYDKNKLDKQSKSANGKVVNDKQRLSDDLLSIIKQLEYKAGTATNEQEKDEWLRLANELRRIWEQEL